MNKVEFLIRVAIAGIGLLLLVLCMTVLTDDSRVTEHAAAYIGMFASVAMCYIGVMQEFK